MALVERDAVFDVPPVTVNDDLLVLLLARQHGREHDAVVVHARFRVEDGHLDSGPGPLPGGAPASVRAPCRCRRRRASWYDEVLGHVADPVRHCGA